MPPRSILVDTGDAIYFSPPGLLSSAVRVCAIALRGIGALESSGSFQRRGALQMVTDLCARGCHWAAHALSAPHSPCVYVRRYIVSSLHRLPGPPRRRVEVLRSLCVRSPLRFLVAAFLNHRNTATRPHRRHVVLLTTCRAAASPWLTGSLALYKWTCGR